MPSEVLAPLSLAAVRAGAAGVAGGTVSIVTERGGDAALAFPATSTAFTMIAWTPSERADEAMLQLPLPSAVAVPRVVTPSESVTAAPGSVVPVKVGVATLVTPS